MKFILNKIKILKDRKQIRWDHLAILLFTPVSAFLMMQWVYGGSFQAISLQAIAVNAMILALFYWLLCLLLRRIRLTSLIFHWIAAGIGAVNGFVVLNRGTPSLPWDFLAWRTALAVSGNYAFRPTLEWLVAMGLIVGMGVVFWPSIRQGQDRLQKSGMILLVLGCFCSSTWLFHPEMLNQMGIGSDVWDQAGAYQSSGIPAAFVDNLRYLDVEVPKGYSSEEWQHQLAAYQPQQMSTTLLTYQTERPHIIAIMNESWADFESYGELQFSVPITPFIQSLEGYNPAGYASVFGAGTSASEFEFLTGHTMAFLPPGSIPYQQYILDQRSSLASILKEQGYRTLAIHPGERSSWQRDLAYPRLGFDEFVSADELITEPVLSHGGYISDESLMEEIITRFEQRQEEEKLFLFAVTIQNHGGYTDPDYPSTVEVIGHEGEFALAKQYLSLLRESDQAFQKLIEYFENQDEPVLIVMFGDHQPALEQEFLDLAYGVVQSEMTMEQYMDKFRVPFVFWSNTEIPYVDSALSLNFLGQHLLDAAGVERSAYGHFLEEVEEVLPVLTFNGYFNQEHEAFSHLEKTDYQSLIEQWQLLQYGMLFEDSSFLNQ